MSSIPPPPGPASGQPSPQGPPPGSQPPQGQPSASHPPQPPHSGSPFEQGAAQPGSKAYVEERFGPQATFADRILPHIIDSALGFAVMLLPLVIGIALIIAGQPDTYSCGYYGWERDCEVPGTGSGALVALGFLMLMLSFLAVLAFQVWNRIFRVSKTGQSLGRKIGGLKVIDAKTGENPALGKAALKELVASVAGLISALWMLLDDDDRTLGDKVGDEAVIKVSKS